MSHEACVCIKPEFARKPGGNRRNELGAGAGAEQHSANLRRSPSGLRQGLLSREQGHVLQRQLGVTPLLDAGLLADLCGAHARPAVSVVADEVGVGAGDLAFVNGDRLKPRQDLESLVYIHRRIRLDGLTQGQSVGPDHPVWPNAGPPIFVLLYPLDEALHVFVARMECHHVIVVLELADFRLRAGRRVPRILVVQDHALPHQGLQFRHRMQAVHHVVEGIAQIIGVIRQQLAGAICGILQGLGHRRSDRPKLAAGAQCVLINIQQNGETAVFQLFVPRRRQCTIASLDRGGDRGSIPRLVHRQENIVALPREIAPASGTLLIHCQGVAIHPETVQYQVAAQLIPALIFARLHPPDNLQVGRGLLSKVAPDDRCKLLKGLEYPEIQLWEKVAGKNNAPVRVDNERLQQHW